MAHLGRKQVTILRSTVDRWFDCNGRNDLYRVCMRLHARGLLRRDPQSSQKFTATVAGEVAIIDHDSLTGEL